MSLSAAQTHIAAVFDLVIGATCCCALIALLHERHLPGYIIIPSVLSPAETAALRDAMFTTGLLTALRRAALGLGIAIP